MAEKTVNCVWDLGTPCDGGAAEILMFKKQLNIPICEGHIKGHKEIMLLYANGYDIEEIVDMDPKEIKRLAWTLILSGMDLNEVEI